MSTASAKRPWPNMAKKSSILQPPNPGDFQLQECILPRIHIDDQALQTLTQQPAGPVLLTVVGVGFAAYGLYCFARARYERQ